MRKPRQTVSRRGDLILQRGGAWDAKVKATQFAKAGLTHEQIRSAWKRIEEATNTGHKDDITIAKDQFLSWLVDKGALGTFAAGNTLGHPESEIEAVAREMDKLAAKPLKKADGYVDQGKFVEGIIPSVAHPARPGYVRPKEPDKTDEVRPAEGARPGDDADPHAPYWTIMGKYLDLDSPPVDDTDSDDESENDFHDAVQNQQTSAAQHTVQKAANELQGASPLEKIKLLETLQMDPNLQEMAKAGLFKWDDIMKDNDGSVVGPDGTRPTKIVDENKLKSLQSMLLKLGKQQQDTEALNVATFQKQRVTPGAKAAPNGFYPNVKVWMPPQYLPGQLPYKQNVSQ